MSINELENVDGARTGAGGIDSTPAHAAMLKTETEGEKEKREEMAEHHSRVPLNL